MTLGYHLVELRIFFLEYYMNFLSSKAIKFVQESRFSISIRKAYGVFNQSTQFSTPAAPQVPPSVEETLKKILENQKTIMYTLVAHGGAIEELGKQAKKIRKSHASKKSVERLRKKMTKITAAGDLPFDLLMETDPSVPADPAAPSAEAPTSQSDEPDLAAHTVEEMLQMLTNPVVPQPDDDEIQLEEPEGGDADSHPKST
nr:uncharacterized protein LOC117274062 isoform X2 [Nicotiana tomentosiformis]